MVDAVLNGEQQLSKQIEGLSEKLSGVMTEFQKAEGSEREKLAVRIAALEDGLKTLKEIAQKQSRLHLPGVEVGKHGEQGKWSWGRMAKLVTRPSVFSNDKEYGYEVEAFREMQKRYDDLPAEMKTAINAGSDTAGAFLVPLEVYTELIPLLEARMVAAQLGISTIYGLTGNVSWTKDEGGITAGYIDSEAEEAINESVPTFSSIELKPHVMGAFVPLTWAMLNQPAIALESWVRNRMAKIIALRKDKAIFMGIAASKEPRGITNTSGLNTAVSWSGVTWTGASQNITDKLSDMESSLANNNALDLGGKLGWFCHPKFVSKLMKAKDSAGYPIFQTGTGMQGPRGYGGRIRTLGGYALGESTQLDSGSDSAQTLGFGDFSQAVDANWGTIAFASSAETETNFRKLRTTIRAVLAHDVGVFQGKAFVLGSSVDVS